MILLAIFLFLIYLFIMRQGILLVKKGDNGNDGIISSLGLIIIAISVCKIGILIFNVYYTYIEGETI